MKEQILITMIFASVAAMIFTSCTSVKEYQKNKLNDTEMQLSARKVQNFEMNSQAYREGASGANGGKISGGCGCN